MKLKTFALVFALFTSSNGLLQGLQATDLLDNFEKWEEMPLPNGYPIPSIYNGTLPSISISISSPNGQNINLYLDDRFLGVFVPAETDLRAGTLITYRYDTAGIKGTMSIVGPDENGENSGLLFLKNYDQSNHWLWKDKSLPNGFTIPGIVSGTLPAIMVSPPSLPDVQIMNDMTFYLNDKFLGLFIPMQTDVGERNILTRRYNTKEGIHRNCIDRRVG